MNEETLANALGLAFQQIQKYEDGANRVSGSRLSATADALSVPIIFHRCAVSAEDKARREQLELPETSTSFVFITRYPIRLSAACSLRWLKPSRSRLVKRYEFLHRSRCILRSIEWGREEMPDAKTVDPSLVAQIVRSYVAHNSIAADELPNLIATVHRSLAGLDTPAETRAREPTVAINRSWGRNFVACLECGYRGKMLRRHLTTSHSLSPSDYRARWNLKDTHPLTAPAYTERRSALAKQFGLGSSRQPSQREAEPAAAPPAAIPAQTELDPVFLASLSQPKRRGRPRRSAPTTPPYPTRHRRDRTRGLDRDPRHHFG
jgi:predicted transcriptional regulator